MFHAYHAFLSVHCSLVATCVERANFLPLLYVMVSCNFVTFLGQVWYLIVPIPDLCLLTYFNETHFTSKYHYLNLNQRRVVVDSLLTDTPIVGFSKLDALLYLSSWCLMIVVWLLLTMPLVCL